MELVLDLSLEIESYEEVINLEEIKDYVKDILSDEFEAEKPIYMSIALIDNFEIQRINRDFRGKDSPTDVISFAYHETEDYMIGPYDTLGDIVISLEKVEEQSVDYGHSFEREFYYVLTHGILHLLGYDHIEDEDKKEMRIREEELLEKFGYTRD